MPEAGKLASTSEVSHSEISFIHSFVTLFGLFMVRGICVPTMGLDPVTSTGTVVNQPDPVPACVGLTRNPGAETEIKAGTAQTGN